MHDARGSLSIPRAAACLLAPLLAGLNALVPPSAGAMPAPQNLAVPIDEMRIRVRMEPLSLSSFTVSGVDLRAPGVRSTASGGYRAWRVEYGKSAGDPVWVISDRDSGESLGRVKVRSLEISGTNVRVNLRPMPNRLTLMKRESGGGRADLKLDVIASLELEDYVRGVLPAEMPSGWPLEALKAQAVAARTFALYRKKARRAGGDLPFDLETNVMDQMYLMPDRQGDAELSPGNVERAVRETRGQVMVMGAESSRTVSGDGLSGAAAESRTDSRTDSRTESGAEIEGGAVAGGHAASARTLAAKFLPAYFHADCGGSTEDARVVWGSAGGGTTLDESCPLNPLAQWKVDLSREQIVAKVRGLLEEGEPRLGRDLALFNIETVGQTGSGRVDRVRLRWSDGRATVLTGHEFRMALGHDRIKSTKFTIERLGAGVSYRLSGKGFGHGVGMCQWGARNLAQKGHDFRSILAHYYPRSRIMKLEPDLNRL